MMNWILAAAAAAAAHTAAPTTSTTAVPSPAEAQKVAAFYFEGKDAGPLLVKTVACLKVDDVKGSKTENECIQPVTGAVTRAEKGTEVQAWTQWVVPIGAKLDDVTVQFLLEGAPRSTQDVLLTESLRMRSWLPLLITKPGKWTIKVQRGGKDLGSTDFVVK